MNTCYVSMMKCKRRIFNDDKLTRFFRSRSLKLAFAMLLAMFLFIGVSSAADIDWSFADHPHPEPHQLSVEEEAALNAAHRPDIPFTKFCDRVVQANFDIYNKHYPQFAATGDFPTRYSAWRYHLVAVPVPWESSCVFDQTSMKISESLQTIIKSGLVFCGVYSRQPRTPKEKEFVNDMNELVDFIGFGDPDAVWQLFNFRLSKPQINLNPDVEYFLRKSLRQNERLKNDRKTSHLEPLLSRERIEFIDQAVKRRDFEAVLQSTRPCTSQ